MKPNYNLSVTSQALEAACVLNLKLKDNGYGADTIESFEQLFDEFCHILETFSDMSIQDAIEFWEVHQDECGELAFG
jgi:hypothetical protein